jgi:hypothetical protein
MGRLIMKATHPDKQKLRDYLDSRTHAPRDEPLPTLEEIREQLGWKLIPENDEVSDQ